MMKVAIIGSNGQLGTDLVEILSEEFQVVPLTHSDIEITDAANVKDVLSSMKPQIVLNASAYNLVPQAEQDGLRAFEVNAIGPLNVARVCAGLEIALVHYSTDYVFDGKKMRPYTEDDRPNPLNVYGTTKLCGEYFVLNYCPKSFVIRVSGIYGKVPSRSKGGNFITSITKVAKERSVVTVVDDEIMTPTSTRAIAKNTLALIKTNHYGLFHMSCEGETSWYEFAKVIWEVLDIQTPLSPVSVKNATAAVRRPLYSVLENRRLNKLGLNLMPHWKDALVEFLAGGMKSEG